eukprot:TRINITY_DN39826_c0_g1_i1.p1 TRINITY_DN39826_c0_g1~~TRINITY_DN39826_c0_g1_i1.p1  ORF type:complete len:2427 (-),score=400.99 TRINITY_DN39826_c0_g1_i1:450-7001(-)
MSSSPEEAQHRLRCKTIGCQLTDGRQALKAYDTHLTIVAKPPKLEADFGGSTDITIMIEGGISTKLQTGYLFADLGGIVPVMETDRAAREQPGRRNEERTAQAASLGDDVIRLDRDDDLDAHEETTPLATPAPELKLRILVTTWTCDAQLCDSDRRLLTLRLINSSVFLWPPAELIGPGSFPSLLRKNIDISVEALSATCGIVAGAISPVLSPLEAGCSVITVAGKASEEATARTEVDLRFSAAVLSAGAWQLRLLADIFSFSPPAGDGEEFVETKDDAPEAEPAALKGDAIAGTSASAADAIGEETQRSPGVKYKASKAFLLELDLGEEKRGKLSSDWHQEEDDGAEAGSARSTEATWAGGGDAGQQDMEMEEAPPVETPLPLETVRLQLLHGLQPYELEPWQVVRLAETHQSSASYYPRFAIRFDRAAVVRRVAASSFGMPTTLAEGQSIIPEELRCPYSGFHYLRRGADFAVEAWDTVRERFVDVTEPGADGVAVCSHLVVLVVPALTNVTSARLVVEIDESPTGMVESQASEFLLTIRVPRLTWCIGHSQACSGSAKLQGQFPSAPSLEEAFGDLVLTGFGFSMWSAHGQGSVMVIKTDTIGLDLYDMSTLSLSSTILPETSSATVAIQKLWTLEPTALPLAGLAERSASSGLHRPIIDIDLGAWKVMLPAWALARTILLVQNITYAFSMDLRQAQRHAGSEEDTCTAPAPRRLPALVRNGLPVPLCCRHADFSESTTLPPGAECAFSWRSTEDHTHKLLFALSTVSPWSAPLAVGHDEDESEPQAAAVWAYLDLFGSTVDRRAPDRPITFSVHACILRRSCAQRIVMILPPAMLLSQLPSDIEATIAQENGQVFYGSNPVLTSMDFTKDMPLHDRLRSMKTEETASNLHVGSVAGSKDAVQLLKPRHVLGVLALSSLPCQVRFRRIGEAWGSPIPLPATPCEPFSTIVSFLRDSTTISQTATCSFCDLWSVPRDNGSYKSTVADNILRPVPEAPLPGLLTLWPLLTVENKCVFPVSIAIASLGTLDVEPEVRKTMEAAIDPRKISAIQLIVPPNGAFNIVECFSSGPLLLGSLMQFPHSDADESVSWRNSVRCQAPSGTTADMMFLLEVRRCGLSGLPRSITVEPMWSVANDSGADIYFRATGTDPVLHVATAGETTSVSMSPCQYDPSFPFCGCFGTTFDGGWLWSDVQQRCPVGRATRVVMSNGDHMCVVYVTATWKRLWKHPVGSDPPAGQPGFSGGGIQITINAAVHVRSDLPMPVMLSLATEGNRCELALGTGLQPWTIMPLLAGRRLSGCVERLISPADLVEALEEDVATPTDSSQVASEMSFFLQCVAENPERVRAPNPTSEVTISIPASGRAKTSASSKDLERAPDPHTSEEVLCQGSVRDVLLLTGKAGQTSMLVNVAYHIHPLGYLSLGIVRSQQPPVVCNNFTYRGFLLKGPWEAEEFVTQRIAPGAVLQLPCPPLRTLEVFPAGVDVAFDPIEGTDPHSPAALPPSPVNAGWARPDVMARVVLEAEGHGDTECEFALNVDSDVVWENPGAGATLNLSVRYLSGVCRIELREATPGVDGVTPVPAVLPLRTAELPCATRLRIRLPEELLVQLMVGRCSGVASKEVAAAVGQDRQQADEEMDGSADGDSSRGAPCIALYARDLCLDLRFENEELPKGEKAHRSLTSRTVVMLRSDRISVLDLGANSGGSVSQVVSIPPLDAELRLLSPSHGLPTTFEVLRLGTTAVTTNAAELPVLAVEVDDGLIEACKGLVAELIAELAVEPAPDPGQPVSPNQPGKAKSAVDSQLETDFRYLSVCELAVSPLPIWVNLQISKPVFLSFTGLSVTLPQMNLANVATTTSMFGQEMLAHFAAFLLLHSPVLLSSWDLLGNPLQAYRHLRTGFGDLFNRPIHEGVFSFAQHVSSASFGSISAVSDSIRRNLPVPQGAPSCPPAVANGDAGLAVGVRQLLAGVGRGLTGVVRWDQHTPERRGVLGQLAGVKNAVRGVVMEPVGGLLDFVSSTARGLTCAELSLGPGVDVERGASVLRRRPSLRPVPTVSPMKFYVQCCKGLPPLDCFPSLLFWSPHCELVRVDGGDVMRSRGGPNLRLVPAGVLLTTCQLCILLPEAQAHVLDVSAIQAAEEDPTASTLVTVASVSGQVWQLHFRAGELGEFLSHLQRARRLAALQPTGS